MKTKLNIRLCAAVLSAVACTSSIYGEVDQREVDIAVKCTKEELMRFFPEQVVESILVKHNVPKEKAEAMAKTLSQKDINLSKIVEKKLEKLAVNPLSGTSQREAAAKVYRETMFEIFSQVMIENGITDPDQIQKMLDELQEARSKLFLDCIHRNQGS